MMLALAASFNFNTSLNPNLRFLCLFNKWVNNPHVRRTNSLTLIVPLLNFFLPIMIILILINFSLHFLLKQCYHPLQLDCSLYWAGSASENDVAWGEYGRGWAKMSILNLVLPTTFNSTNLSLNGVHVVVALPQDPFPILIRASSPRVPSPTHVNKCQHEGKV